LFESGKNGKLILLVLKNIRLGNNVNIIDCTIDDLALLAELSIQLLQDEKNDDIPCRDVIKNQFERLMNSGSKSFFFKNEDSVVGFALVKMDVDPYYLTQFYICREYRRMNLGTTAFKELLKYLKTNRIDLDVFVWNGRGRAFWHSLGFRERCVIMRRDDGLDKKHD
jgi:ribosomal protein S18 acetylase RimI-like enzyme